MKTGSAKALKSLLGGAAFLFAATAGALTAASLAPAGAATLQVLHDFCSRSNCTDGGFPTAGLLMDSAGNLYGTTEAGGSTGWGVAFELMHTSAGWREKVLHVFCSRSNCTDGGGPAGLTMDGAGNLYGTTYEGGNTTNNGYGSGVVFELTPTSSGWKESVLHDFCSRSNCADGANPYAGLVTDAAGNLYGTTYDGGYSPGYGVAFELTPTGAGWREIVLHRFCSRSNCTDGGFPTAGLLMDSAGNLYGTASEGGTSLGGGVAFELTPTSTGWRETLLHLFCSRSNCGDGSLPSAGLVMDSAGNLYGTTYQGGNSTGSGVAFALSPTGTGWKETVLHDFCSRSTCTDGANPNGLVMDAAGNLYGTTGGGGIGGGVAFALTPTSSGWRETLLHLFCSRSNCTDGAGPAAGLTMDSAGNLYGTTFGGGSNGTYAGVAFAIVP